MTGRRSALATWAAAGLLAACDPYARWPAEGSVFPWVFTPEEGLEAYEEVRFETGTWDPGVDLELTGLYALKSIAHRRGAPRETLLHHGLMRAGLVPLTRGDLQLDFVGDVMWTGGNWSRAYVGAAPLLDGQLRVGNLETPISENHPTDLGDLDPYSFNAPPALLDSLPLDVVQVNNNHSLDVGNDGLEDTLRALGPRGFLALGVDAPAVVVEVDGVLVGLVAATWGFNDPDEPTTHELFVVPFGDLERRIDLTVLTDQAAVLRERGVEIVVAMVHWGFEYEYYADPHFLVLGRRLVAGGFDVVVGSGPHVLQPAELCTVNVPAAIPGIGRCSVRSDDGEPRVAAILPSLGNFGAQPAFNTAPTEVGMIASVSVAPGAGVTGLRWRPVVSVREGDGEAVVPLDEALDDPVTAAELDRLRAHLGTRWLD